MDAPLYNSEILRLTTAIPFQERLSSPQASVEKRSPICGSRVTVELDLDDGGRVSAVGLVARACALGQASTALLGQGIIGKTPEELAVARDTLTAWLAGQGAVPRMARARPVHTGAAAQRAAPLDPAGVGGCR